NADERTRLRIGNAEAQELIRPAERQDGEIALHEARREPCGRAVEAGRPAGEPDLAGGLKPAIGAGQCGLTGGHVHLAPHAASAVSTRPLVSGSSSAAMTRRP